MKFNPDEIKDATREILTLRGMKEKNMFQAQE